MRVLVGIPTHKRPKGLRACLESIAAQEGDLPDIEVFVADNDPIGQEGARAARELARGFRFPLSSAVVAEPGISAVRNAILEEGRESAADFIAMIDDDETASSQWLGRLLEMQRQTSADIVGGAVQAKFSGTPSRAAIRHWTPRPLPDGTVEVLNSSANFLVGAGLLDRLDMPKFDSAFGLTGGGDTEWFERVKLSGASFAWSNEAITFEHVPPERCETKWLLKREFRRSNGRAQITRRHRQYGRLARLTVKALAITACSPLLAILVPFERYRWGVVRRLAGASGHLSGLFGYTYSEYASRHARRDPEFKGSADYWEQRYLTGGNSGAGSYNRLAQFKADFLNDFVTRNGIRSVIEFGSGDGAQLELADYPSYIGVDVSRSAIDATRKQFGGDPAKTFLHSSEFAKGTQADLSLSLDVIYHLVEDEIFEAYMGQLFDAASRFAIVYSSNVDAPWTDPHVRHRCFTDWVKRNRADFALTAHIPNRFPFDENDPSETSFADFYVFERT
jgi:glycosyltransferase involved in cell wall biosynthesis